MTPGGSTIDKTHLLPRWRWTGLAIAVCVGVAVWLLDLYGAAKPLDGPLYDACARSKASLVRSSATVLLVYADRADIAGDTDALAGATEALIELGARKVGFAFQPQHLSPGVAQLAQTNGPVILGREFQQSPADPESFEALPTAESWHGASSGWVGLPATTDGVYRNHFSHHVVDGRRLPSLEHSIAQQAVLTPETLPDGHFAINFRGRPGSLPHVEFTTVTAGGLVPELVEGRVVLIGLASEPTLPGIATPTTDDVNKMSLLEYHGHVLNTLLTGSQIRMPDPVIRLLLLLLAALAGQLIYQRLSFRSSCMAAIGLVVASLAISLACLIGFSWWLPGVSLVVVQIAGCVATLGARHDLHQRSLTTLATDQSMRMRRRRWPVGFFTADDPWSDVAALVYQMFYFERLFIFERPAESDHLRIVKTVNCMEDDVQELRRDCRRWPFDAAVDLKAPLRLDEGEYTFLEDPRNDEAQYLVPLVFDGQVYGYLALGVSMDYLRECQDFAVRLQTLADEIAVLLYRRRWIVRERKGLGRLRNFLTRLRDESALAELGRGDQMLDLRLTRMETARECSDTGTAIYDIFGHLLTMNPRFAQLLQARGVVPSETTVIDVISTLTGRNLFSCRQQMRELIEDKCPQSLAFSLDDPSNVYLLNLRPLQMEMPTSSALPDEAAPFELHGIYCELIDGAPLLEMRNVKDRVADHLCRALTQELEEVNHVVAELSGENVLDDKYRDAGHRIKGQLDDVAETLRQCREFLAGDLAGEPGDGVPVDASAPMVRAIRAAQNAAHERQITLRHIEPDVMGHVLANPRLIETVFSAVLDLMLTNARDGSAIEVLVQDGIDDVTFTMASEGGGASAERLRQVLHENQETSVQAFRRLREVRDWVQHWGGRMVLATDVGKGITARLVLKRYLLLAELDPPARAEDQRRARLTDETRGYGDE